MLFRGLRAGDGVRGGVAVPAVVVDLAAAVSIVGFRSVSKEYLQPMPKHHSYLHSKITCEE